MCYNQASRQRSYSPFQGFPGSHIWGHWKMVKSQRPSHVPTNNKDEGYYAIPMHTSPYSAILIPVRPYSAILLHKQDVCPTCFDIGPCLWMTRVKVPTASLCMPSLPWLHKPVPSSMLVPLGQPTCDARYSVSLDQALAPAPKFLCGVWCWPAVHVYFCGLALPACLPACLHAWTCLALPTAPRSSDQSCILNHASRSWLFGMPFLLIPECRA